jgi:NADH-quinone oxidoreductase subunit M
MLGTLILLPLLGAILIALIPRNYRFLIRFVALAITFASMVLAVRLFLEFIPGAPGYQAITEFSWLGVPSLGLNCSFGVDGINIGLILMGAIVAFAAACVSHEITRLEKEFYLLLLIMTGGVLGAFASRDLFFFYFFHELALVPTFIMIGVWGRGDRRNYAAFQITIYLSIGALLALIGLIGIYLEMPVSKRTFDILAITEYFRDNPMSLVSQNCIFALLLFGFGILVSLWPFHTWAPLGYGSAPTATAMIHAGVLKKFGLYGLLRIAIPLMPQAAQMWLHVVAFLCLGNILHCGFVAMRQRNLNLLIGNSSVAHMGFVFLGIASMSVAGVTGAVLVMVAHGFLAALTFALSGWLYQQTNTLDIDQMGGLLQRLPFIGAVFVIAALAGCGVPGFANFPGELLVLFGSWKAFTFVVVLAAWGALVIGAVYMLRAVRNILHGPADSKYLEICDARGFWRKVPFALLVASLLLFGCFPRLLTEKIKPGAEPIVKLVGGDIHFGPKPRHATASLSFTH